MERKPVSMCIICVFLFAGSFATATPMPIAEKPAAPVGSICNTDTVELAAVCQDLDAQKVLKNNTQKQNSLRFFYDSSLLKNLELLIMSTSEVLAEDKNGFDIESPLSINSNSMEISDLLSFLLN